MRAIVPALCFVTVGIVACGEVASSSGAARPADTSTSEAGSSSASGDSKAESPGVNRLPLTGRPAAVSCTGERPRPAGNVTTHDAGAGCKSDGECTEHAGGRCNVLSVPYGGPDTAYCSYDACTSDADCAGSVCGCDVGSAGNSVCLVQGNCRVDADCGDGEVCAFSKPVFLFGSHGAAIVDGTEVSSNVATGKEALGYFCTTPKDECPRTTPPVIGPNTCVYQPDQARWIWAYGP